MGKELKRRMREARPANYVAKKIYFDWQQLEHYKMMAEFINLDVETVMHNIITQGMDQLNQHISKVIEEEQTAKHEPIPEKTPEQVQATKDIMFPDEEVKNVTSAQTETTDHSN